MILLLAAGWLQAQEAWPLERCIQYALEHNTGIREQRIQIDLRKAELRQMQTGHLPVLRAGVAQEFNWGRSVDMQELVIIKNKLTQATGATLTATATLFEGFAQHYGRLAAKKAVEAARQDARSQDEALTIDVTRAYLQLMLARQILSYTEESLSAIILQRERTALMVEAGSQPKTALSEIEAQVAAEKAAMVEASCRVRTDTLALTRLMNLP
ncbi:MAG: TolC family protein, partial [Bacteroidales bacterium]|nr:TolC family protein [Bacteroidales bacterium]